METLSFHITGLYSLVAASLLALGVISFSASAADFTLVEEGKLTVAFNGDMPGTGYQDGKLIGGVYHTNTSMGLILQMKILSEPILRQQFFLKPISVGRISATLI